MTVTEPDDVAKARAKARRTALILGAVVLAIFIWTVVKFIL
jgi:hypothetical protein